MNILQNSKGQAVLVGKVGVVLVAAAGALITLLVASAMMPEALQTFFGMTSANASAAAGAIFAGMDVATAVSIFGGATAIGGVAFAAVRRALGKKALIK